MELKKHFTKCIFLYVTIAVWSCSPHGFHMPHHYKPEELIFAVYEFLEILITTDFEECDVNILYTNTTKNTWYSDAREDFIIHLMRHSHWAQTKLVELGVGSLDLESKRFDTVSPTHRKISMNSKHSKHICHIYILEIWNPKVINSFLYNIKNDMVPTPLRFAKCILINWTAISSSLISLKGFQPTLLHELMLQKLLIYKAEITISYNLNGNDTHGHVLLYGSDFECKPNNAMGFTYTNFKLLGAFSGDAGFRNYTTKKGLLPINKGNFCQMKLHVAVPDLSGIQKARTSEKRQDLRIANRMFRELNFQVDSSSYILLEGAPIGKDHDEQLAKIFARYPMSVGITHFQAKFNKHKLRPSKHYGLETLIMVYRSKVSTQRNHHSTQTIQDIISKLSVVGTLGATLFLFLSKRWDLLSKARLPRPSRDRESWKFQDRRLTVSRWLECYWEVNELERSQKRFPQLNLKRYTPSATILLTCFCFFANTNYFCVKLSTMTFIDKSTTTVRFHSMSEALEAIKFGQHMSETFEFKLVTRLPKEFWSKYINTEHIETSADTTESVIRRILTTSSNLIKVNTAEECITKIVDANQEGQCYICIGVFDAHFRRVAFKRFENDHNEELQFQRVGLFRLTSMVYAENFPWVDVFEDKMTRFIESGIFNMWIGRSHSEFRHHRKEAVSDRFTNNINSQTIFSFLGEICIHSLEFAAAVFFLELLLAKRKIVLKIIKILAAFATLIIGWITRNLFA